MNTKVKKILPFAILIIILLSIIIGILASPKTYAATTEDGLFDYLKVYDNNTKTYIIKITKCNDIGETNISIPSLIDECEVKIIGEDAIPWANKIETLYIPETITIIEDGAFNRSLYMKEISVNDKNNNYCSENGILFNKDKTEIMHYPAKKEDTFYQIPSSVTIIGDSCFYACGSLTNVNIPSNVVEIKRNAFKGCYSIQEITLPQGLTALGDGAFSGASQLKQITIPNGIKKIESETFASCLSLENAIMHDSITSIGTRAFEYCYKLDNVEIPNSVTVIEDAAFCNCRFEKIIIPDGVKSIKNQAFTNNSNLKIAVIPDSVEEIEWLAFSNVNSDFKVYLLKDSKTEEYINSGTNCFKENTLYEYLTIDHITIKEPPTKTSYYVGDNFDNNGLKIIGVYKYDNDKNVEYKIDSTKYTITPNQSLTYGTKNVTINYTHNNVTKSTTQPITVKKIELENISITSEPSNKTYIEGQNFDKTGMKVIANYNNGTSKEVTNYTITDENNLTVGRTTITVSYTENDVTKTTTQAITVSPKVLSSIRVSTAPSKTAYIEGQSFDATGMKVTATYNNGSTKEITNYTITDGNNLTTDKTSVTISYIENEITKTTTQTITVSQKALSSIRVSTAPSKTTYIEGQDFDATGMKVTATYNNGYTKEITNYTITDGNNLTTDKTSVTISYIENEITKTTTQTITVSKKTLSNIKVSTEPSKKTYIEGQNFDTAGMKVTATYDNGSTKEVTNYTITNGNNLTTDKTSVTISYTENSVTKTTTQAITVVKKALTSIEITTAPARTTYIEGQNFDATGMKVTAKYSDNSSEEITNYTITDGNDLTTDKTSVTISYTENGITKTQEQSITVNQKTLNNIRISTPPSKTTYVEGQNFDATGMKVVAIYNNESEKELTNYTITDGNNLITGKTNVTISYTENNVTKTATQSITVSKKVLNAIAIKTKPNKTEYIEEQNFDTTGMKVTATYNDGTSKEVTNYTVTDGNKLAVGKATVTVSYTENEVTKTVDQAITVSKKTLSSIRISTAPNKTTYIEGQNFDATGMKVTATYDNSTNKQVTDYTITGGNNLTTDKTSVTISYTESGVTKTTTQPITVTKKLEISFDGYNEVNKDGNKYIDNIAPSTTVENLINNVETNGTITVYKDNKEITDKKIKISTGMKVKISLNNENHEFTVVVKGDTNGDGESNLRDLLQINKHRLNKTLLTAEYLLAGDVNKDNEVNLKDLLQINKFRLGKINTL